MKKETIMNRLGKGGYIKKDGSLKTSAQRAVYELKVLSRGGSVHPLSWNHAFRHAKLEGVAKYETLTSILTCLKIKFTEGNDAPKGGKAGDYIELDKSSRKKLQEIINIITNL